MEQGRLLRLITSKSAGSTPASATNITQIHRAKHDESKNNFAGVAQLVEHLSCKQNLRMNVTGSIPFISLKPVMDASSANIHSPLIQENDRVAFLLIPFTKISLLHHQLAEFHN